MPDLELRELHSTLAEIRERLNRIVDWHTRETGPAGMVGDYCNECGHIWPCDTFRMATGTYEEED